MEKEQRQIHTKNILVAKGAQFYLLFFLIFYFFVKLLEILVSKGSS